MQDADKPIWAIKFRNFCFNNNLRAIDVAEVLNLQASSIYKYWAGQVSVPDPYKKILEKKLGLDIYETFYNEDL